MSDPGRGLASAFAKGRPALVCYLMAGYPDRATSLEAVRAAMRGGADLIELGVPYADALADGPVIVRAANAAMRAAADGFGLAEAMELAEELAGDPGADGAVPLALMTYYNPMLRLGLERTAALARRSGIGGFIVPDLPPEAAGAWLDASAGIDTVFLAAPTSTLDRLVTIAAASRGFVYCVSTTGVTGERESLPPGIDLTVRRVREHSKLPVAVGFGISTPEQVAAVARIADGAVVGSAIVKRQTDPNEVENFVRSLATALRDADRSSP